MYPKRSVEGDDADSRPVRTSDRLRSRPKFFNRPYLYYTPSTIMRSKRKKTKTRTAAAQIANMFRQKRPSKANSVAMSNLRRSTRKRRVPINLEQYTDSSGTEDKDLMVRDDTAEAAQPQTPRESPDSADARFIRKIFNPAGGEGCEPEPVIQENVEEVVREVYHNLEDQDAEEGESDLPPGQRRIVLSDESNPATPVKPRQPTQILEVTLDNVLFTLMDAGDINLIAIPNSELLSAIKYEEVFKEKFIEPPPQLNLEDLEIEEEDLEIDEDTDPDIIEELKENAIEEMKFAHRSKLHEYNKKSLQIKGKILKIIKEYRAKLEAEEKERLEREKVRKEQEEAERRAKAEAEKQERLRVKREAAERRAAQQRQEYGKAEGKRPVTEPEPDQAPQAKKVKEMTEEERWQYFAEQSQLAMMPETADNRAVAQALRNTYNEEDKRDMAEAAKEKETRKTRRKKKAAQPREIQRWVGLGLPIIEDALPSGQSIVEDVLPPLEVAQATANLKTIIPSFNVSLGPIPRYVPRIPKKATSAPLQTEPEQNKERVGKIYNKLLDIEKTVEGIDECADVTADKADRILKGIHLNHFELIELKKSTAVASTFAGDFTAIQAQQTQAFSAQSIQIDKVKTQLETQHREISAQLEALKKQEQAREKKEEERNAAFEQRMGRIETTQRELSTELSTLCGDVTTQLCSFQTTFEKSMAELSQFLDHWRNFGK